MAPPVFLIDPDSATRDEVVLSGPEGRHAAAVRRISPGEAVDLTDGAGTRLRCVVSSVGEDRSTVVLRVWRRSVEPPPQPSITVVQALPKGERGELAVEGMTEAGVDRIVPWEARNCVARWKADRAQRHLRKWRDTAREAAKQARRSRIPEVTDLERTPEVAKRLLGAALAVVLDQEAPERLAALALPEHGEIAVVVGPEGGVDPGEAEAFAAAARPVALGPSVLRTSTAGLAAAAVIQARCGRW